MRAVDAGAGDVGAHEPHRPAEMRGEGPGPRSLDQAARDRTAEEVGLDGLSQLHLSLDGGAVREAEREPVSAAARLRAHLLEEAALLAVEEPPVPVDQVEAPVARDPVALEGHRAGVREREPLDRGDRQPNDLHRSDATAPGGLGVGGVWTDVDFG